MTIINEIGFNTWSGEYKRVDLLSAERPFPGRFATTVITGRNGSHKSTLLKEVVSLLVVEGHEALGGKSALKLDQGHLLCISGSAADRFPQKELPGGTRSMFDVPNYTYVGQRVINNLLSKKAPLETMLAKALDPAKVQRFKWKFFGDAHAHAGVHPSGKYSLEVRRDQKERLQDARLDLLGTIQRIQKSNDSERYSSRIRPHLSYATAQWLLQEFSNEEFGELERLVSGKLRRLNVFLDEKGPQCKETDPNVLRLGLLTDFLRLGVPTVKSFASGTEFSALELSSGEFHIFSSILAVGFGIEDKAVLLFDEPENNLHPQWQRDLMTSVFGICDEAMVSAGHAIICTHSPLIVASVREGSTVVDLSSDPPQVSLVSYGASSDELLLAQFGVGSSRNSVVVDTVQRAVSLVERGDFDDPDFKELLPDLRTIRDALTANDPMVDVINALLDEEPAN